MSKLRLFLLRHGKAERITQYDPERELTERGRADLVDVAAQFLQKGEVIDHCLVSPYRRAQQTAEAFFTLVARDFPVETQPLLTPENSSRALLKILNRYQNKNLLLVGHNLLLSEFLALMTENHFDYSSRILGTAELACLEYEILAADMARCLYVLQPERRYTD